MSYAQTANKADPKAMIGALGVPAGIGLLLVTGLAIKGGLVPEDSPFAGYQLPIEQPEEVPPPPKPVTEPVEAVREMPTIVTPPTRPDTPFELGDSSPITTFAEADDFMIGPVDIFATGGAGEIAPLPPLPDPVSATPRNDPGRWVSDSDYRSNWIRREWTGVAGFAVTIDTNGRVSDCTITRSTGHAQMDTATCSLIERRARFDPAKDRYGNPVTGTYRNSVNWRLPE